MTRKQQEQTVTQRTIINDLDHNHLHFTSYVKLLLKKHRYVDIKLKTTKCDSNKSELFGGRRAVCMNTRTPDPQ